MSARERDLRDLAAYHDGELGRWRRLRLEARLARSPELRAELAWLRGIGQALREADARVGAPDLWPGVAARLDATQRSQDARARTGRPLRGPTWRPVFAGLAVAAAALAAAVLLWPRSSGRPAPPLAPPEPSVAPLARQEAAPAPAEAPPAAPAPAARPGRVVSPSPAERRLAGREPSPVPVRGSGAAPALAFAGSVRNIDTEGRPFLVQESREATIIWLIDAPGQEIPARGAGEL